MTIPDPRVPMLSAAIADLVAGYEQVRAVLDGYEAPDDVQRELLAPLQRAAERATAALGSAR
jgi:hypothetical protein